jgi:PPK2 family polyphosphate:nucleotide phosphotransferase
MESLIEKFQIKANSKISIKDFDPKDTGSYNKENYEQILNDCKQQLKELQEKFYVNRKYSLLIILQAMDAAGKDSAIEHVMSGLNPQGCRVESFKEPSVKELSHDFLWRHVLALPEKGIIGIHNRSHYENVLVCKVHPELVLEQNIPDISDITSIDKAFWKGRYESICDFEKHLNRNGTIILKFFLNISKEEQKERFLKRIDEPQKNWKFSAEDIKERSHWDEYMEAYEKAISETSMKHAPWFIIPADKKWFTRIAIINIVIEKLKQLQLQSPDLSPEEKESLESCKKALLKEDSDQLLPS